jgi:hypothetical protein
MVAEWKGVRLESLTYRDKREPRLAGISEFRRISEVVVGLRPNVAAGVGHRRE